jgi:hypothetical protein
MRIGDVEVDSEIIQQQYRIGVLEKVVEVMLNSFPRIGGLISQQQMLEIRRSVVAELQKKYPNSNVKLSEP